MRLRVMLQMLLVMWWRNFSRFDIVPEYKVLGSDIRRSFQRIKSLPFVPVYDISYAWEVLKPTIPSDMADFSQYYESTWIGTPDSPAKFDPACWNQHDPCSMLTKNFPPKFLKLTQLSRISPQTSAGLLKFWMWVYYCLLNIIIRWCFWNKGSIRGSDNFRHFNHEVS